MRTTWGNVPTVEFSIGITPNDAAPHEKSLQMSKADPAEKQRS